MSDQRTEQLESLQANCTAAAEKLSVSDGALAKAAAELAKINQDFVLATARAEELALNLANAQQEIAVLKAAVKTVDEVSAMKVAGVLAEIGVPPVTAESQPTAPTAADLWVQYEELNLRDSRAAGKFYNEKIRPLVIKEK